MKKVTLSTALTWLSGKNTMDDLMKSYLQISSQILRTRKSNLYRLYSSSGEKEFNASNLNDIRFCDATGKAFGSYHLDVNDNMQKCVQMQKAVLSINKKEGMEEIYYPIRGQNGAVQVLYLQSADSFNRDAIQSLNYLSAVYKDHYLLLQKSEMDPLTGAKNRYAFSRDVNKCILRKAMNITQNRQFLAVMDIDHFKQINDTFGHIVGDEILLQFARLIERKFFEPGGCCRYGGDEFSTLFEAESGENAFQVLEDFHDFVGDYRFPNVGRVTASIGFTEVTANDIYLEVIERAERALFYGKENGIQQTHLYETLMAEGFQEPMMHESDTVVWKK